MPDRNLTTRIAQRHLQARKFVLTPQVVAEFRKEFLMLMKNLKRVQDYEGAMALKEALRTWNQDMDFFFEQIRDFLEDLVRTEKDSGTGKWAEHYLKELGPSFGAFLHWVPHLPVTRVGTVTFDFDFDFR